MNITKTNVDKLNAVIALQIVKEDYENQVNDVLKDYRRKAKIDGFRPGKAPIGLIKKMYGPVVLAEEVKKIIDRELSKFITDNNLDILGDPLPHETEQKPIDWNKDENFEFSFDIAMSPEYILEISKKDKVHFFRIKVDETMIQRNIEMHTNRFGSNKEIDNVEEKSILKGNFAQIDAEGTVIQDGIAVESVVISPQHMKDDDAKNNFIGSQKKQTIVFNPAKAFPNETDLASMLNISKDQAENLKDNFQYTITEITKFVPAEINQELFDKAFGEGIVNSYDEFENKIKEEIANQLIKESNYKFLIDVKEKLLKKAKIELPEAFLKRWIPITNKDLTKEQLEKDFDNYADGIRWQLIKEKLIRNNDLKISEEEIKAFAKSYASMQFQQYGMGHVPEEYLENYAIQILQNEKERNRLLDQKTDDTVLTFIKENIKIEEKEVTMKEFYKLFEK